MADQEPKEKMSFLGHLEELRWRLVRASIVIVVFAVTIFIFTEWLMDHVLLQHTNADFITYQLFGRLGEWIGAGTDMYAAGVEVELQAVEVMEQFGRNLMLAIVGGIVCSFPYLFFELWGFVKPGLKQNEQSASRGVVFYSSLLFFLGIGFGYFVVAPLTVQFFGNYQMHPDIENKFRIGSYLSIVITSTFMTGLFFQLPVVSYLLSKIGLLTPQFLKKFRKHSIVALLILSAIITPPDIISQVIVTIPLIFLYEMSIIVSKRVNKKRTAKDAALAKS
jgi:sec-independent protein translocase protein TatC